MSLLQRDEVQEVLPEKGFLRVIKRRSPTVSIVVHLIAWLGYFGTALFVVPGIVKLLEDSDVSLPALTVLVIRVSHWAATYWPLWLMGIIGIAVIDLAIDYFMEEPADLKSPWQAPAFVRVVWFVCALLPPLIFFAAAIVGFGIPLFLNSK
jgi:hypothetical protein